MSKYYLSRSITRAMSADHPIGDPTGGAAYGEKNDPISAGLAIYGMSASYGAMMAGSIMAGITFAGSALSLVGNITGNKTLSKIGMVAGVVGGLGQMGAFGEAAKGASWKDIGIGGGQAGGAGVPAGSPKQALTQTPTEQMAKDLAARNTELANAQNIANQNVAAGAQTTGRGALRDYSNLNTPASDVVTGGGPVAYSNASAPVTADSAAPSIYNMDKAVADRLITPKGYDSGQSLWDQTKNILSSPLEFAKDNPYGAMAIGQTAQPIAEYLSGKTDAEIEALEAQTRANEANAGFADARTEQLKEEIAREKMRRRNLNAGYMYVNTGFNVNPNANLTPQGLISKNMQPAG